MLKSRLLRSFAVLFSAVLLASSAAPAAASSALSSAEETVVGNWETAVYVDGELFVTRVALDKDGEVAIMLREFMAYLGYYVGWDNETKTIDLISDRGVVKLSPGAGVCCKNGEAASLAKPVYLYYDRAYLPESVLREVLGIEITSVDKADANSRVNGVYVTVN